jgi:hypothetical protein
MGVAPFVVICFLPMLFFVMGTVPDQQINYSTLWNRLQDIEKIFVKPLF